VIPGDFRRPRPQPQPPVPAALESVLTDIAVMHQAGARAVAGGRPEPVAPLGRLPEHRLSRDEIQGLDIPTFIRRQMD